MFVTYTMIADSDQNKIAALVTKILRSVGKGMRKIRGNSTAFYTECTALTTEQWSSELLPGVLYGSKASDLIFEELLAKKPSMICRFGTTELATIASATTQLTVTNALKLVSGHEIVRDIGMHEGLMRSLCSLSGFFPPNLSEGREFVKLMLADMKYIDILGVWCKQESNFSRALSSARKVRFRDMEPYMHENPWSRILAGRKVLVVHPFSYSIEKQYSRNRKFLFSNPLVLPEFELQTITAVQSIANNPTRFAKWFDALRYMMDQISNANFDVAIIGCGAYGMPLAAHVKRIGKKAVHLGGQTQLLFGIKGKRWEAGHGEIRQLFNDHWVYPDEKEKPQNFSSVEQGAYW
jgi:hypothetical protein